MIEYYKGAYGLNLLFRLHGSAVYKAFVPGLVSILIFFLVRLYHYPAGAINDPEYETLDHPYAVGVLVSSVSFLIIFRANFSYQRYWEACGMVHQMMSKMLDATVHTSAYHMQCDHYSSIKPPVFFDHPDLLGSSMSRDRESKSKKKDNRITKKSINSISEKYSISRERNEQEVSSSDISTSKDQQRPQDVNALTVESTSSSFEEPISFDSNGPFTHEKIKLKSMPSRLLGDGRLDGGWNLLFQQQNESKSIQDAPLNVKSYEKFGDTPSLFLQELAHLSSLMIAVAFCTLRNDVEGSESPLGAYTPGQPWPAADPDKMTREEKKNQYPLGFAHRLWLWLGFDRSPEYNTRYNATRPMLVIGGVSENEIAMLQRARGASAKTALAWYWLSEFIIREHLAGSTGKVGPPIISRIFQFVSDAMIAYNHARKIMYIPFPFPHAQLSALFIVVMVLAVPYLMDQYANEPWLGATLTFLTVVCLAGLHEVGRELENPFRNTPNEIPLITLLAFYNESLIAMCSGYHPDAYWESALPDAPIIPDTPCSSGVKFTPTLSPSKRKSSQPQETNNKENNTDSWHSQQEIIDKQAVEIRELRGMIRSVHEAL